MSDGTYSQFAEVYDLNSPAEVARINADMRIHSSWAMRWLKAMPSARSSRPDVTVTGLIDAETRVGNSWTTLDVEQLEELVLGTEAVEASAPVLPSPGRE